MKIFFTLITAFLRSLIKSTATLTGNSNVTNHTLVLAANNQSTSASQGAKQASEPAFFVFAKQVVYAFLLGSILIIGAIGANAQSTVNYLPSPTTVTTGTNGSLALDMNSNAIDMTTGTTSLLGAGIDDGVSALTNTNLGVGSTFEFFLMGSRYANFGVTANGIMTMGVAPGSTVYAIPNTTVPTIAAFANDMQTGSDGNVIAKIVGTAPNRTLVIQWTNIMVRFITPVAPGTATWQVRLYESTGAIEYVYGAMATNAATPALYYVGLSSNTTVNNVVTLNTSTNAPNTTATVTSNSYTASSTITSLNSTSNGSRKYYRFIPPTTAAPTAPLTFSAITAGGMTLNWAAASPITGIVKYAVYSSTDGGTTYNYLNTTLVGTNTLAVTGLTPGTSYTWRVVSVSEGAVSNGIAGTQATTAAATYYWVGATGGDWNTAANWNTLANNTGTTRATPLTSDILVVDGMGTTAGLAGTISVSASASIGSLQITNSTATTIQSSATTQRILTLTGSVGDELSIGAGSSILLTNTVNPISMVFATGTGMTGTIAGTLTVAGTTTAATTSNSFLTTGGTGTVVTVASTGVINNVATANITTNGNVTGSAATLVFANGSQYNVSGATTAAPWIPLATWNTTSTVTISGITTSTTTATNAVQSFGNFIYNCPAASGTMSWFTTSTTGVIKGDLTITATGTGLFRALTTGTLNVTGNVFATGGSLQSASSTGSLIVSGNTTISAAGKIDILAGTYSQRGTTFTNNGVLTGIATTSTLQFLSFTNTAQTYTGTGTVLTNVGVISLQNGGGLTISTTNNTPVLRVNLFIGTISGSNLITIGTGAALATSVQIGSTGLTTPGGSFAATPTFNLGTGTYSVLYQYETAARTTGFEIPTTRSISAATIGNLNNITVAGGALSIGTLTLQSGNLITSAANIVNITGATTTSTIRSAYTSAAGATSTGTTITVTSTTNLLAGMNISVSAGVGAFPPGTTVASVTNTTTFVASAAPITALSGGASVVSGIGGWVNGPLQLTLPPSLTGITTYSFPIGKSGFNPLDLVNITTGAAGPVIMAEVFDADAAGTAGVNMTSLNSNRYWATSLVSGDFTSTQLKLTEQTATALGTANAIASSASLAGAYDLAGGASPTVTATTITTQAPPLITTLANYYALGIKAVSMSYVSSTTTQAVTTAIVKPATNQQIIGVQIVTLGNASPLTLSSMDFNTTGSTSSAADIANARVYYTGTSNTFATTTQFGADVPTPSVPYTVTGSQMLAEGTNYFWLVYDVPASATVSNVLDAECIGFNIGTVQTPSVTAPAGTRIIKAALNGIYQIGASQVAPNYTKLTDAILDLNAYGVGSAVTFALQSDYSSTTETFPLTINAFTGASATNTLTIKPAAGVTSTISGALASAALIKLNGADYVTVDGSNNGTTTRDLTITNTATTASTGISFVSLGAGLGATNNTIKNCNISTGVATSIGYGIAVGGNTPGTSGADNDNVTLQNNAVTVAPIGIYANGTASVSTGGDDNLAIIGNSITYTGTLASLGMQLGNALNSSISQNTVSEETTTTQAPTGISLETGFVSSSVTRNNITKSLTTNTGGYGGRGITIGTGTATSNLTIANNFISGVSGSNFSGFTNSSSMGIAIGTIGNSTSLGTTTGGINVYYNSVNMYGSMGAGSTTALTTALYIGSGASVLDIRNNLLVNNQVATSTTQKNYAIYSAAANTAFANINYNDYFVSNTFNAASAVLGNIAATDRTTLATLTTGFGGNGNSINVAPVFTSNTDLHLVTTSNAGIDTKATAISTINDFDNDARDASTPDIGADEFTSPGCTTALAGTASGSSSFCGSGTPTITATGYSSGTGSTYQWISSTVLGDYPNAGNIISGQTNPATLTTGLVSATTYYWLRVTCATNTSTDNSSMVTITVNPLPVVTIASGVGTFCTSTIITASNGNDGTMYFQGTTSGGISTTTASSSQTVTSSGTYYFRAQSALGCWGPEGSVAVVIQTDPIITGTAANICANEIGTIAAVAAKSCAGFANAGTTLNGTFTATDLKALRPTASIINTSTCSFDAAVQRGYQAQQFRVSVTGSYAFDMTSTDDGMAYITTGAFVPGNCSGGGTWIKGDDDTGPGNDPQLLMTLTAGTTYTLYSTTYSTTTGNSTAAYSWAITPPVGGQLMLQAAGNIEWYTSASGGTAIGTGSPFNPVGVAGSGLANTNTAGTTTFYAACSNASICRTAVNFVINANYSITASAGLNGSISPSGVTTLSCLGTGNQTYTITPNSGYNVADVLVDGVSVGAVVTYTFTSVIANHTITASFVVSSQTITASAGTGGSISPSGSVIVAFGANQTFNITPNTGYAITNVLVDGLSVGTANTYTFTNVTVAHTIAASFTIITVVESDPALVAINITDATNTLINANLIPYLAVNTLNVPILNFSLEHAVPSGTIKVKIDLGDKLILNNPSALATVLPIEFSWTFSTVAGHQILIGDQIAVLPIDYNAVANFDVKGVIAGTSLVSSDILVTNHNNATETLVDIDLTNNHSELQYTILSNFTAILQTTTNVSCYGGNNGSITVLASGGTTPYRYSKDNGVTWQTSSTFSSLIAGAYSIRVEDFVGQFVILNYTVTQPTQLVATAVAGTIGCFGGTTTVTVSATGGTSPYTGTGAFTVSAGAYSYTVTDANGCTSTVTGTVSQPTQLVATAVAGTINCFGGTTTVTVSATGGTAPYTGTGAFTVSAGAYSYTVTDANGCTSSVSVTITQAAILNATVTPTNAACAGNFNSATITISNPTGGSGSYQYSINGGTSWQNSGSYSVNAGTYNVQIRDANSISCSRILNSALIITEAQNTDVAIGSQTADNLYAANGDEKTIAYNLTEINGKAATASVIRIFKPAGYQVIFNQSLLTWTDVNGFPSQITYTVDNSKWVQTFSNSSYVEFSRTGTDGNNTIGCNEQLRVVFTLKRNTLNISKFNLNVQFRPATGEIRLNNNSNSIIFTGE